MEQEKWEGRKGGGMRGERRQVPVRPIASPGSSRL